MHLDSCGLVALWREALLAQAVLNDETKGYRHHPQLFRFRAQFSPISFIAEYLRVVHAESVERGFGFDSGKILPVGSTDQIDVPAGQIDFEWRHLTTKLMSRAPGWFKSANRGVAQGSSLVSGHTRRNCGLGTIVAGAEIHLAVGGALRNLARIRHERSPRDSFA